MEGDSVHVPGISGRVTNHGGADEVSGWVVCVDCRPHDYSHINRGHWLLLVRVYAFLSCCVCI